MINEWCVTHKAQCYRVYGWQGMNIDCSKDEPLAPWEKELLTGRREGSGDVTFHLKDGSSFTIENVDYDTISGIATNNGVITGEFTDSNENMFHVPNVLYWTVNTD